MAASCWRLKWVRATRAGLWAMASSGAVLVRHVTQERRGEKRTRFSRPFRITISAFFRRFGARLLMMFQPEASSPRDRGTAPEQSDGAPPGCPAPDPAYKSSSWVELLQEGERLVARHRTEEVDDPNRRSAAAAGRSAPAA